MNPTETHKLTITDRLARNARACFPRGLRQPEKGYRFCADTLLLGSFPHPAPQARVLDLGTGCGGAALAMLCRHPGLSVLGLDIQPEYLAAARENAILLGFGHAFTALCADVADFPLQPESFDEVIVNPPYRQRGRGRLPANPARLRALFELPETLAAFCGCASHALKPGGRLSIIFPAPRRDELLARLRRAGLSPMRLMRVSSHETAAPRVILVEALKPGAPDNAQNPLAESSLTLHSDTGFSAQALRFCPFLGKRSGPW